MGDQRQEADIHASAAGDRPHLPIFSCCNAYLGLALRSATLKINEGAPMTISTNAAHLKSLMLQAGAKPYDMMSGRPETKKVSRLRLANGHPVVLQLLDVEPRLWMLPKHENGAFRHVGEFVSKPGDNRHSGLAQVREFRGQELVKVVVNMTDPLAVRAAVAAVSC